MTVFDAFKLFGEALKDDSNKEHREASFKETVDSLKEFAEKAQLWLEDMQKANRPRVDFSYFLENDVRQIVSDYAYEKFDIVVNQLKTYPLPCIRIEFKTKCLSTEEQIDLLAMHLRNKITEHMSMQNVKLELFPFYLINGVSVLFEIYYCEYPDEYPQFCEFINKIAYLKAEQKYGVLEEDKLKLHFTNNKIILGVDGSEWSKNGCMFPIIWDYMGDAPHLLLGGTTGSGKSVLAMTVLRQLLMQKKDVRICDYKAGKDWRDILPKSRYAKFEECDKLLDEFYEEFRKDREMENYIKCNDKFLVFDEVSSYLTAKKKADFEETMKKISILVSMGREYGYHMIFIGQQFSAKVLETSAREQFGIKIHLGKISTECAGMMYPGSQIDKDEILPKYSGYISKPTTSVFKIQTATVNPFKLKKELQELGKAYFQAEHSSAEVGGV